MTTIGVATVTIALFGLLILVSRRRKSQTSKQPQPAVVSNTILAATTAVRPADSFQLQFFRNILGEPIIEPEEESDTAGNRTNHQLIQTFRDHYDSMLDDPALLPRQPLILPRLLQAIKHPEGGKKLVSIVLEDPGLTAEVLKLANSPLYRNTKEQTSDLDYAVVMLGEDGLKSLISASVMRPIFRSTDAQNASTVQLLWDNALASATIAQQFAERTNANDIYSPYLLVLLSCLSELIILKTLTQHCASFGLKNDAKTTVRLMTRYGYETTQKLMSAWSMEKGLISQLANDLDPVDRTCNKTAQQLGRVAGRMVTLCGHDKISLEQAESALLAMGVDDSLLGHLLQVEQ